MTRALRAVLVCGGGPVGVRVVRACKELGIRSVAAYPDGDPLSAVVQHADEAVRLEPDAAVEGLVDVARAVGADGVHPGDGPLAERAGFARGVRDAGLVWFGADGGPDVGASRAGPRRVDVLVLAGPSGARFAMGAWERTLQLEDRPLLSETPAAGPTADAAAAAVAAVQGASGVGPWTCGFRGPQLAEVTARVEPEHAMMEVVTGLDLVQWQLRGTCDPPVETSPRGVAIGARITGSPGSGGRIEHLQVPSGPGVRWDGGIEVGSVVEGEAVLGMLTVWAEGRDAAVARLRRALGELVIAGTETSREFLLRVAEDAAYQRGMVDDRWFEGLPTLAASRPPPEVVESAALAAALLWQDDRAVPIAEPGGDGEWARAGRLEALRRR